MTNNYQSDFVEFNYLTKEGIANYEFKLKNTLEARPRLMKRIKEAYQKKDMNALQIAIRQYTASYVQSFYNEFRLKLKKGHHSHEVWEQYRQDNNLKSAGQKSKEIYDFYKIINNKGFLTFG